MSINRYNPKRDANEPEIVEYFKKRGLSVERLNTPLDLLIGYKNHNYLVEVKMPKKNLNANQEKFVAGWAGQHVIIRSVGQARVWADKLIFGS